MPFEIQPMQEADLDAYEDLTNEVFRNDVRGLAYPNGPSPAAREHRKQDLIDEWRKDPEATRMTMAVDPEAQEPWSGNIIGVAKWKFIRHPRSPEDLEAERKALKERTWPPGARVEVCEDFFNVSLETYQEIVGTRAHVVLGILAVSPRHWRRGVGARLLQWGIEQADSLGLPMFIESTLAGRRLYEAMGFVTIKDLPFDGGKYGHPDWKTHCCLMREPSTESKTS